MTSNNLHETDPDSTPFFTDTRTLAEKLQADERSWMPHKPAENAPAVIYGLVLERGTFTSSYGDQDPVPTMRILTRDNVIWSVIAFHGWLESELIRKNPMVGDFAAVAFNGTKQGKAGEHDPYVYRLEIERNPDAPIPVQEAPETPGTPGTLPADDAQDDIPF